MKKDLISRNKQIQSIEFRLNRLDQNRSGVGLAPNTGHLLNDLEKTISELEAKTIKQIERIKNNAHLMV